VGSDDDFALLEMMGSRMRVMGTYRGQSWRRGCGR
jgi:hypothetical protein